MLVYILLYIFEVLFCFAIDRQVQLKKGTDIFLRKNKKIFINLKNLKAICLTLVPLWLIMGFRYGIGKDFFNYQSIYEVIRDYNIKYSTIEYGYYLLNKIVSIFFYNNQTIFIVVAFISVLFYIQGFLRKILIPMVAFIGLGYYFYAMNIMRQYLAIAIVFLFYNEYEKGNWKKFVIGIVIAAFFHKSVLIWFPILLLIKFIKGKKFYIVTFAVALLGRIAIDFIMNTFVKYSSYIVYFTDEHNFGKARISYWNVFVSGAVLLISILFYKQMNYVSKNIKLRMKLVWIMFLGYTILGVCGDATIRMVLNFSFCIILLVGDFFECFSGEAQKLLKGVFVVLMFLGMLFILNYSGNAEQNFVPYISCFGK